MEDDPHKAYLNVASKTRSHAMGIMNQKFAQSFSRMADDGWMQGWHEANGGNLSYRLKASERELAKSQSKNEPWQPLDPSCHVPNLANECFMITAAGSHFRSMGDSPKRCLGIIEIDSKGTAYRNIWGFKGKGKPTSELPTHLLIHAFKKETTNGRSRVVYHAHPSSLIVLSSICGSSAKELTFRLWESVSEAAIVFPEGIGLLPWMVPGSIELGIAACKQMVDHDAVALANHGLIACGDSFDRAFGLVHTIEKASEISIKIGQLAPDDANLITVSDLKKMSKALSLDVDLRGASEIREDKPFKPSFGTISVSL